MERNTREQTETTRDGDELADPTLSFRIGDGSVLVTGVNDQFRRTFGDQTGSALTPVLSRVLREPAGDTFAERVRTGVARDCYAVGATSTETDTAGPTSAETDTAGPTSTETGHSPDSGRSDAVETDDGTATDSDGLDRNAETVASTAETGVGPSPTGPGSTDPGSTGLGSPSGTDSGTTRGSNNDNKSTDSDNQSGDSDQQTTDSDNQSGDSDQQTTDSDQQTTPEAVTEFLLRPRYDGERSGRIQFVELPAEAASDWRSESSGSESPTNSSGVGESHGAVGDQSEPMVDRHGAADDRHGVPDESPCGLDGEAVATVVSHDLRNPLDVAKANLQVAIETDEKQYLQTVADAHDRMEEIIDDVLTLARTDEIAHVEPVDLGGTARTAWESVATGDAGLSVESPLPPAEGDRDTLERLFENLFRNAVEHAGEAPAVRIGAIRREQPCQGPQQPAETTTVGFYVADDGPGIDPADREAVFESGFTSDGGTGLGLAIARRIVAVHGWSVDVTESADGGARFEIVGLDPPSASSGRG